MLNLLCRPQQWRQPRCHPAEGHDAADPVPGVPEESRDCPAVCESQTVSYFSFIHRRRDKSVSELVLYVFVSKEKALCCSSESMTEMPFGWRLNRWMNKAFFGQSLCVLSYLGSEPNPLSHFLTFSESADGFTLSEHFSFISSGLSKLFFIIYFFWKVHQRSIRQGWRLIDERFMLTTATSI